MSKKPQKEKKTVDKNTQDGDKLMKAVTLLSLGAFLFFFYVSLAAFSGLVNLQPDPTPTNTQVLGASVAPDEYYVEVMLNNANLGEGILELDLTRPTAIAGAEFHFDLEDSLAIQGVVCSSQFVCVDETVDGTFNLSLFRLPDQADIPLNGKIKVATLIYDDASYGEMVLNGPSTTPSIIAELGNDQNLLNNDIIYLSIGRRAY